jgi:ribosome maturation protein Sdo1
MSNSQQNILRSFTLFAGKSHYMTIAATNENDVSAIIKKLDPKNKIRFEAGSIKARTPVHHKVIVNRGTQINE